MSGGAFLSRMADASRARARAAAAALPERELAARARTAVAPARLELGAFDVIAELKLRSPAAGGLAEPEHDMRGRLDAYARGGAAAVSVLTEPDEFEGDLEHLRTAAAALTPRGIPVMRKDFLTEPYQVVEARAAGASGVLVIVTMLDDTAVRALVERAHALGMFVLLEGFDERDLKRIAQLERELPAGLTLAGVNCRDLRTLAVEFGRFESLSPALPPRLRAVAESGIEHAADVEAVARLGYGLCLVGSALMRAADPAARLAEFLAAGRAAARGRG